MAGFFAHIEAELDRLGFFNPAASPPNAWCATSDHVHAHGADRARGAHAAGRCCRSRQGQGKGPQTVISSPTLETTPRTAAIRGYRMDKAGSATGPRFSQRAGGRREQAVGTEAAVAGIRGTWPIRAGKRASAKMASKGQRGPRGSRDEQHVADRVSDGRWHWRWSSAGCRTASAKELSDKSVKVLMDYAWAILPEVHHAGPPCRPGRQEEQQDRDHGPARTWPVR